MKKLLFIILITFIFNGCFKLSKDYKPLYLTQPEIENIEEK
ncbi:hypothetical protein [Aliarcobacter skirrowii]|uniref:Lipoprotein n=1 Tax=Aliarcobacter skirrowii TaxID=28200 RepID=A0AAW9DCJ3_9BACT|nr:hypothetical protein [Aliarcobacter skirrowii]MDX4028674.1 hypothetical protein [Aliarcobacter skirrowii]MDX4070033.1 hypothetical protein [Aliarcobacter skirrowii]SUV14795.1 Uncharacterised protein [Aliarcobacter skirrowii]